WLASLVFHSRAILHRTSTPICGSPALWWMLLKQGLPVRSCDWPWSKRTLKHVPSGSRCTCSQYFLIAHSTGLMTMLVKIFSMLVYVFHHIPGYRMKIFFELHQ